MRECDDLKASGSEWTKRMKCTVNDKKRSQTNKQIKLILPNVMSPVLFFLFQNLMKKYQ